MEDRILLEARNSELVFSKYANATRNLLESCAQIQSRISEQIKRHSHVGTQKKVDALYRKKKETMQDLEFFIKTHTSGAEDGLCAKASASSNPDIIFRQFESELKQDMETHWRDMSANLQAFFDSEIAVPPALGNAEDIVSASSSSNQADHNNTRRIS